MYFIAVHAGAGYHGRERKEAEYTSAMRRALKAAADCLDKGCDSMAAVRAAISVLEDDPVSNAGFGSNLTMEGTVECDASIMCGDGTTGAVGAVPGVPNPIAAAHELAVLSRQPLPCGLIRPVFLAGDAARRWALAQGLTSAATVDEVGKMLVSPAAAEAWRNYRAILQQAQAADTCATSSTGAAQVAHTAVGAQHMGTSSPLQLDDCLTHDACHGRPIKKARLQQTANAAAVHPEHHHQQQQQQQQHDACCSSQQFADVSDTVGCIVVDGGGRIAAGVSSGGLALKTPGRVGEAAVIGAGAWAADGGLRCHDSADGTQQQTPGVCVSVSGVGERIMASALAKTTGMQLQVDQQQQCEQLAHEVLSSSILNQPGPWDAGIIAARVTCGYQSSSSCNTSPTTTTSNSSGHQSSRGPDLDAAADVGGVGSSREESKQQLDRPQLQQHCEHRQQHDVEEQIQQVATCQASHAGQQQQRLNKEQQHVRVEFAAAFTSESFAVGYLCHAAGSSVSDQPCVQILRRSDTQHPNSRTFNMAAKGQRHKVGEIVQGSGKSAAQQPAVKCLVVSCSWPAEAA